MLRLPSARHVCDCHWQSDGVWLASDLDVLDVSTIGTGDSGSLVGCFLDLAVVG